MMNRIKILNPPAGRAGFLIFIFVVSLFPFLTSAHPGGVDTSGCHVCRTKCEQYNVPYNVKHCHIKTGTTTQTVISTPPAPVPVKAPAVKPKAKVEKITATSVPEIIQEKQTASAENSFIDSSSILWFSSAAGIGLLAGLGFIFSTKKP